MDTNTYAPRKRGSRAPLFIILGFFLALVVSLLVALASADELGATPRGMLANELGITLEQADDILAVFDTCSITGIKEIEHDPLLDGMDVADEIGYRMKTEETTNIILHMNSDGTLRSIRFAGDYLYKNGKPVARLYYDLVIGLG